MISFPYFSVDCLIITLLDKRFDKCISIIATSRRFSIGYPVVTLGFGFKSYVGYRMRMRRQKEVQRENDYYFDFLRMALPPGQLREEAFNAKPSPKPCE